ncbi:MAG: type II toxin-antitoxin system Phd/YefM family antitoxin [Deltaproteobacteria bacterium]|nr:type II toxin-antitoxin system Phd/YefM family antitoxin [Deltaproteobacteria bacterium]
MGPVQLTTDVVSVGELEVQAARILRRVNRDRCPVVTTQHGRPAGVLVSPRDFDDLAERSRFAKAVGRGLGDVESGRVVEDEELDEELEKAFKRRAKK